MAAARSIEVVDRLDILDLYARQAHAIDSGRAADWAQCFTADGVFVSPTYNLTATGRTELTAFAESSNSAALARGDQLRHWLDAIVMTPTGSGTGGGFDAVRPDNAPIHAVHADTVPIDTVPIDTVHVEAYLMILATSASGSRVDRSLRVLDDLRRVDGEWYLLSRTVFRDA
ncbi:MAG: hypothetical protein JWQ19_3040 [Subtercola sp.]|nr:hypothetical protein [Subtercola sp.]